jgi:hypothetical protein
MSHSTSKLLRNVQGEFCPLPNYKHHFVPHILFKSNWISFFINDVCLFDEEDKDIHRELFVEFSSALITEIQRKASFLGDR